MKKIACPLFYKVKKMRAIGYKSGFLYLAPLVLLFSGCAQKPEEAEPERMNIAFQKWVGYGPLYLAKEKGFFKEEGMELVIVDEPLDSARRDAFKQGMLDCEAGTIDLLITKRAQNIPIVAVMEIDHSAGGDGIVAAKGIKKVEDLKGRRVALERDNVGETLLAHVLDKKGMALADIIIVPRGPEDAWEAFLKGDADAVVTWQPWLSKALERPGAHVLLTTRDKPDIIIDTLNVREDMVKNRPGLVKKLMRGWFRAVSYYKAHPVEASGIIAHHYDITPEQYRKQGAGLRWENYKEQLMPGEEKELIKCFNTIAGSKFAGGRISKKPDAKKAFDRTLLRTLYEDRK